MMCDAIACLVDALQLNSDRGPVDPLVRENWLQRWFPWRLFVIAGKKALPEVHRELGNHLTTSNSDRFLPRIDSILMFQARRHTATKRGLIQNGRSVERPFAFPAAVLRDLPRPSGRRFKRPPSHFSQPDIS